MFNFNRKEKGQGLVEYALILVLASIVVIVVMQVLGPLIGNVFTDVNTNLVSGGGGQVAQATATPAATATPVVTLGVQHDWNACSGTCTNTWVTCTGNVSVTTQYLGSAVGGSDGSRTDNCSSSTWVGNFYPGTVLNLTNNDNGTTVSFTVPAAP
jgi:pilus assembly protein Flp/PilA